MPPNFKIQGNTIILEKAPRKPKKVTGTRFASILGLNPWQTPFQTWCDITGFYKEPFEENIYTNAGKTIEPLVINYLDKRYYFGRTLIKTPLEWFGKTVQQMKFDHFPSESILGGMWDARTDDCVYELKTTKRAEDWYKNSKLEAPEYYKLQAALYAYLLGLDKFRMVLTILNEVDYQEPEKFQPTPQNTHILTYSLEREYPQFQTLVNNVLDWHEKHILTGISPDFDGKKNEEILKAVRTQKIEQKAETSIQILLEELEPLQTEINQKTEGLKKTEEIVKKLKEELKRELRAQMKDTDKKITIDGKIFTWELALSSGGFDGEKFKKENPELYEKYQKTKLTERLTLKLKEAI